MSNSKSNEIEALLNSIKNTLDEEHKTPLNEKRVSLPVAILLSLIVTISVTTWAARSFFEEKVVDRFGKIEIQSKLIESEIKSLLSTQKELKQELKELKKIQQLNNRDLDELWRNLKYLEKER